LARVALPDVKSFMLTVDLDELTELLGGRPESHRIAPIAGERWDPRTLEIAHVSGERDGKRFAFALKVLARDESSPAQHDYWKRELEVYRSGALDRAPAELRAPRMIGYRDDVNASRLWLEWIEGGHGDAWHHDRLVLAARHLARFGAAWLDSGPPEVAVRINPRFLSAWLETRAPAVEWIKDPIAWRQAAIADQFPSGTSDQLLALWERRDSLLAALERMPRTFSHLDAHPSNLFDRSGNTIAIDWGHAGPAAIGEELAQLILDRLLRFGDVESVEQLERDAFNAYVEEIDGDRHQIRRAYAIHAVLHWVFNVGFVLRNASNTTERNRYEARMRSRFPDLVRACARRTDYLLRLAREC
jgi:hypothetical protein